MYNLFQAIFSNFLQHACFVLYDTGVLHLLLVVSTRTEIRLWSSVDVGLMHWFTSTNGDVYQLITPGNVLDFDGPESRDPQIMRKT